VRVGDICDQIRGVTYSSDEAIARPTAGYLPVLRANNISESGLNFDDLIYVPKQRISKRQLLLPGDVVVAASSGSLSMVGKAAPLRAPFQGSFGAFCKVLRPGNQVDPNYFAHFFRTNDYRTRVSALAAGLNINNLKSEHLDDLRFPLLPIDEQRRLSAILEQADEIRRKRRLTIERLATLPQAIFHDMFGELSPGRGASTLGSVINDGDRINYGVIQPGSDLPDGVPLIRVANIVNDDYRLESLKRISTAIESQYKRSRLRGDELLVACVGSIGAVSLASPSLSGMNIARAVARIPIDEKKANRVYIAEMLRLPETQRYFSKETRTVAQPTLNIKQLIETPILTPPRKLQDSFADRIATIRVVESQFTESLNRINALFASLQHRVFEGELSTYHPAATPAAV
jgi:type I restriction enzyme, S subunit